MEIENGLTVNRIPKCLEVHCSEQDCAEYKFSDSMLQTVSVEFQENMHKKAYLFPLRETYKEVHLPAFHIF